MLHSGIFGTLFNLKEKRDKVQAYYPDIIEESFHGPSQIFKALGMRRLLLKYPTMYVVSYQKWID